MKNIYFVNGFLDAGKTTFIKELLECGGDLGKH